MLTENLFNNCNSFALIQKILILDGISDGVLMAFLPYLSKLVHFQDKKIFIFISAVLFELTKIANQF